MKKTVVALAAALTLSLAVAAHAGSLTVSGAASLTAAFGEIKTAFEKANPGTTVTTNFAASGALLAQMEAGAPVDVFASADQATMDRAQEKKLIDTATRKDFAANALVLARPKANPNPTVTSVESLADAAVKRVALGNPDVVPVGRYTREVLTKAGLWDTLAAKMIYGENVKQVLDYVSRGEVDAGFVFATDARIAADKVDVVAEPKTATPVTYPLAVLAASANKAEAKKFADFVTGPAGMEILAKYGFKKP